MTVRKDTKTGLWQVDISGGINPITGKRRRYTKRNIKTTREALELEPLLRAVSSTQLTLPTICSV